MNSGGKVLS